MTTPTTTWLVAFDFSDLGKAALAHATKEVAARGGGRIVLAHVHAPATDGMGIDLGSLGPGFVQNEQLVIDAIEKTLVDFVAGLTPVAGVTFEGRLLVGRPADKLVELAREVGAELIAIGSHGRRGFERLLLGSVAERVLRLSDRPVLVIKA
ncbi:MAG: universal stress protein [Deltaproteobacteria bacterium]|nr:universal stress protein [Deltaproteobacteria bacterium]